MRHRRRSNTQTIQRKSHSTSRAPFSPSGEKRFKGPLWFLVIVLIISAGFFYRAEILEFLPFGQDKGLAEAAIETEKTDPQPAIPAEKAPEHEVQYFSPIEKKIQLEILNGCGEKGVAKKLAALLKKSKYDIVNSGNYMEKGKTNWNVQESKIIDQVNDQESARDLADLMGILYSNVEFFDNPSPIADLTIVIGKDYKLLSIFQ